MKSDNRKKERFERKTRSTDKSGSRNSGRKKGVAQKNQNIDFDDPSFWSKIEDDLLLEYHDLNNEQVRNNDSFDKRADYYDKRSKRTSGSTRPEAGRSSRNTANERRVNRNSDKTFESGEQSRRSTYYRKERGRDGFWDDNSDLFSGDDNYRTRKNTGTEWQKGRSNAVKRGRDNKNAYDTTDRRNTDYFDDNRDFHRSRQSDSNKNDNPTGKFSRRNKVYDKRPRHTSRDRRFDDLDNENISDRKDITIRLNRFISNAGVCSRRDADDLIINGEITVNGITVNELGTKVKLTDKVEYNGRTLDPQKKVYLLLNKPKGTLSTFDDPEGRKTVYDIIKGATKERIYSVGRLDRNTTGLLLFTNNGDMATVLTHPTSEIKKLYHVVLDKNVLPNDIEKLRSGIELEDGMIAADDISYANDTYNEVGIEIHCGRNRIVRRMFEALGYEVVKLDRVVFAGLTKKNLPRGEWRMLTPNEVTGLLMLTAKKNRLGMGNRASSQRPENDKYNIDE